MKHIAAILTMALIAGCTMGARDTLRGNISEAGDIVASPAYREIHYKRDGNAVHYYRLECEGELCPPSARD